MRPRANRRGNPALVQRSVRFGDTHVGGRCSRHPNCIVQRYAQRALGTRGDDKSRVKAISGADAKPANFFKHGKHKQPHKDVVSYVPSMAEMILIDNIAVYERLFNARTQMMSIYAMRFSLTHPEAL